MVSFILINKKICKNDCGKTTKKVEIKNLWIVINMRKFNPVHYHDGHISGVGYLVIPKGEKNKKEFIHLWINRFHQWK